MDELEYRVDKSAHTYLDDIESAILRSMEPIDVTEQEEINIHGEQGIWINKSESINFTGPVPISEYPINQDENPIIILKSSKNKKQFEYIQELAIRYLKPPTPPAQGDIEITQEPDIFTRPAPPFIIRQQPPRAPTPEPLVIREVPPDPPTIVTKKLVTIKGRKLPPPPRKVVIERLAQLPERPQPIIVERWLPYTNMKRRVVFKPAEQTHEIPKATKNVIVQWTTPSVQIKKEIRYLGVINANPIEYLRRFGDSVSESKDLPEFVREIETPGGLCLAADCKQSSEYELVGQVEALRLVDLDLEGLSQYRNQLDKLETTSNK